MDLKAFNKIIDEAEEAIAERRVFDALSLTEAIFKDTTCPYAVMETDMLRQRYTVLLQDFATTSHDERSSQSNVLIRQAIDVLQKARDFWKRDNAQTSMYATLVLKTNAIGETDLISQLQRLTTLQLGQEQYHTALDATFTMLWCLHITPKNSPIIATCLTSIDSFARCTLVSALLLGILDYFCPEKLQLLLALGKPQETDSENESNDLQSRVAVALTIISQRYDAFLSYFTDEMQQMRAFLEESDVRKEIPTLLYAITAQSATFLADHDIESIESIVKELFKKQQPRLDDNEKPTDDGKNAKEQQVQKPKDFSAEMLDISQIDNEELFNKLSNHARKIDELRTMNIDVNQQSFTHLKHFSFFLSPAHWFYPFNTNVPLVQQALTRRNGKVDRLTLSILGHNRFCSSDCYSYVSMMAYLRRDASEGKDPFNDVLYNKLEEFQDSFDDFSTGEKPFVNPLHPLFDYCQSLQRFTSASKIDFSYPFRPFDLKKQRPLPFLPLFQGLFDSYKDISPTVNMLMQLGGFEEAIVLLDYSAEHFGVDAQTLYARGHAFMQLQQWQRALSAFQQQLLFEENADAQLSMARCYEAIGYWDKALPLLINEEQRQTDIDENKAVNIIEETGRCLIELQRWDEAVQRFFRLELMEKHINIARRAIAWCSIKQGKFERAATYYQKLIDQHKANWEDRLNCGHALWMQGLENEALEAYKLSQTAFNRAKKEQRRHFRHWAEAFNEDSRTILAARFDRTDCALMLDAVALQ